LAKEIENFGFLKELVNSELNELEDLLSKTNGNNGKNSMLIQRFNEIFKDYKLDVNRTIVKNYNLYKKKNNSNKLNIF
jgi:hypothetical protein